MRDTQAAARASADARTSSSGEAEYASELIGQLRKRIELAFRGKPRVVELVLTALFARGHVLLEDVPGVGKTTLARALAQSLDLTFRRIQFTSDLLPSDVVGVSIFNDESRTFELQKGPIFANLVLADEINRTTPRTQSSLLEAMNERQVTIDNTTYELDRPFMVLATQNPLEFSGTYPLPESQVDRFLMRVSIGYPDEVFERDVIRSFGHADPLAEITAVLDRQQIVQLQTVVSRIHVGEEILDYLMAIVTRTRNAPMLELGVSTRGAMALFRAAQAHALVAGRDFVTPADVKSLAVPVLAHRVTASDAPATTSSTRRHSEAIMEDLVDGVPIPR